MPIMNFTKKFSSSFIVSLVLPLLSHSNYYFLGDVHKCLIRQAMRARDAVNLFARSAVGRHHHITFVLQLPSYIVFLIYYLTTFRISR